MSITNITFDPMARAIYIMINDNKVHKSVRCEDGVVIDYDYRGRLVGLELLNVTQEALVRVAKKFELNLLREKARPIVEMMEYA